MAIEGKRLFLGEHKFFSSSSPILAEKLSDFKKGNKKVLPEYQVIDCLEFDGSKQETNKSERETNKSEQKTFESEHETDKSEDSYFRLQPVYHKFEKDPSDQKKLQEFLNHYNNV